MSAEAGALTRGSNEHNIVAKNLSASVSSDTFTKEANEGNLTSSSSSVVACQSRLSSDVDRWIRGSTETTGVQISRSLMVQRSTLATVASVGMSGLWYLLAALPFFSINSPSPGWRCNTSTVLNALELFFGHVSAACELIRGYIRRLSRDQAARETLATVLDSVLVVYAIGFLLLAMYQAVMIASPRKAEC